MRRAVVLKHTESSKAPHFDFLIDQPELLIEHRLICFKSFIRPDLTTSGKLQATRIADHRAHYLTYEGPISGNRGDVSRVANGVIDCFTMTPDSLKMLIKWDDLTIFYDAIRIDLDNPNWLIQCEQR
ncbi:MAG: hypothetical protein P1U42_08650 [Phycisphaerales bacterium]|nr:hypothetical protein [Phycisphaerales bacterium]